MADPAPALAVPARPGLASMLLELSKPRILTLVLVATAIGFYLGGGGMDLLGLSAVLGGVALVTAAAGGLNHLLERDVDALMARTSRRPLPTGALRPAAALTFVLVAGGTGLALLVLAVNYMAALLAAVALLSYGFVYTPLKRVHWINTLVGAVPGALPPLIGFAAASGGRLGPGGWLLAAILFAWQHPHFYAIAWLCREDYERGGFRMLPSADPTGRRLSFQILLFLALLVGLPLVAPLAGAAGIPFAAGAGALGVWFLTLGVRFAREQNWQHAKALLRGSVIYLPVLLVVVVIDSAV